MKKPKSIKVDAAPPGISLTIMALKIKRHREQQGLTLRGLAAKCRGASHSAIYDAEYGADIRVTSLVAIAEGLGVKASYLLGEK